MFEGQAGETEVLEFLIKSGGDINAKTKDGATPLKLARKGHREEAVKVLLKAGAEE